MKPLRPLFALGALFACLSSTIVFRPSAATLSKPQRAQALWLLGRKQRVKRDLGSTQTPSSTTNTYNSTATPATIERTTNLNHSNQNASDITSKQTKPGEGNIGTSLGGSHKKGNDCQESTSSPNSTDSGCPKSNDSGTSSNGVPDSGTVHNKDENRKSGNIPSVVKQHSTWIALLASILLCGFILFLVHIIGKRRRRKLAVAPEDFKSGSTCSCSDGIKSTELMNTRIESHCHPGVTPSGATD
ncbi:uncharacterized protein LOC111323392 [Stylophora pistillata]|uniref:Uncharacterized protein n=1 Tax=Stylophora pistillata TaxID=50429 RepID=A0A2B4SMJ1_STYPI|nr:uncharacterized protein LOC111323392 [Stylophora pistillata]PFX30576.1 hypothetical protein AWC38_SpisGene4627 [Stylophora pistillata]